MKKTDEFRSAVFGADGSLQLPTDQGARKQLALDLLGACIVGAIDSVVEDSQGLVDGRFTAQEKYGSVFDRERPFVEGLAGLSTEQKSLVNQLLAKCAYDSLYWVLVKLTDFYAPEAYLDAKVARCDEDGEHEEILADLVDEDFFHYFHDWVEKFCETGKSNA